VIDRLAEDVGAGLLATGAGRFFGWVIGGTLPATIAADWLASAWDQNAASYALSPAASVTEEICGAWLKELLGLPAGASYAFVTGCQMAHLTALAAARHRLLSVRGFDVEKDGLSKAPRMHILAGDNRHESLIRAARVLGIGAGAFELVPCGRDGGMSVNALRSALRRGCGRPTVVCLQAGDMNIGAYDPFAEACAAAHGVGAWVHVDGAFGLWAAASPRRRHLLHGVSAADSWATDGHKWLNLPHDSGFVFTADPEAHSGAFAQTTSYGVLVEQTRRQLDWNPEWSRRARAFTVYAAIQTLGREGIAALVDKCCDLAAALIDGLGRIPGTQVLARARINQGLVRFLDPGGRHDDLTDAVVAAVQHSGEAFFTAATWRGMRVMRVSVCSWRTAHGDIAPAIAAVRTAMAQATAAQPSPAPCAGPDGGNHSLVGSHKPCVPHGAPVKR
jgi:glutamate/tyrosine decarboxylase-like PLP-dependent enzyme